MKIERVEDGFKESEFPKRVYMDTNRNLIQEGGLHFFDKKIVGIYALIGFGEVHVETSMRPIVGHSD